jgi:hypothetical protein
MYNAFPVLNSLLDYLPNGFGFGVVLFDGGNIGILKLGWSPVSVFKKATILEASSFVNSLPN